MCNKLVATFVAVVPGFNKTSFKNEQEMVKAQNKLLLGQVKKIWLCPSTTGILGVKHAHDIPNESLKAS